MENKQVKVLAIDDNHDNLISLKALIAESLPEVKTLLALSGTGGLELAKSEDPDVILLDIIMPGMDGYEVCRQLKADPLMKDIPVVFVTALKGDRESRIRALEAGAEAFLAKPVDPSELTAQIRAMVKIKYANSRKRNEAERLTQLVDEQTRDLKLAHDATLKLLDDLRQENEARKKSENELFQTKETYLNIINSVTEAIYVQDAKTGVFIDINRGAENIYGMTRDEIIGQTPFTIAAPGLNDLDTIWKKSQEVFNTGMPARFDFWAKRKNGEIFPKDVIVSKGKYFGKDVLIATARDITERKQAEDTNRTMAEMLNTAPNAITVHNTEGHFLYANHINLEFHGYSESEFMAINLHELDVPESEAMLAERFRLITEMGYASFEVVHYRKDGSTFPLEVFAKTVQWKGKPAVLSIATDITKRKQTESELQEKEHFINSIAENSPNIIYLYNIAAGRNIYTNRSISKLLGYHEEELTDEDPGFFEKLIHPDDLRQFDFFYISIDNWEENQVFDYEYRILTKAGEWRWFKGSEKEFQRVDGKIISLIGTVQDVTDKKQAEEALRQTEEKYKILVETSQDGISMMDVKGNLLFVNQRKAEMLRAESPDALVGKNAYNLLTEKSREAIQSIVPRLLQLGAYNGFEAEVRRLDGSVFLAEFNFTYIADAQGNYQYVMDTMRDITDRKKNEEILQQSAVRARRQRAAIAQLILDDAVTSINMPTAFKRFTQALSDTLDVERTSIWLLSEDGSELRCKSLFETTQNRHSEDLVLKTDVFSDYCKAMRLENLINAEDAQTDPRTCGLFKGYLDLLGITSMLDAGIQIEGRLVGVVCLEHVGKMRQWHPDDESFVTTIAAMIGQLISNYERKKAEETLRESEEKFRLLITQMEQGLAVHEAICDENGKMINYRFIELNESFEKLTGLKRDEILGKSVLEAMPQTEPYWIENYGNVVETGKPLHFENFSKELGKYYEVVAYRNREHQFAVIITDITKRKRSEVIQQIQYNIATQVLFAQSLERLLEKVQNELSQFLDTTNFLAGLYDSETQIFNRVVYKDEKDNFTTWKAENSLSGQVVSKKKTLLLSRLQIQQLAEDENLNLPGTFAECWLGVPLMTQTRVYGTLVLQSYTNPNAFDAGSAKLLEMVAHEISIFIERQQMVEDLTAAKHKAEENDRLKSAFLANMSHEIRTPMNGILGFTDLLKDPDNTPSDQLSYLDVIEKSGQRLLNLINDLIDISKIEAGQVTVTLSEVDILQETHLLYSFFEPETDKKQIYLSQQLHPVANSGKLITDKDKFISIFSNLIKNAVKFTDTGGIEFGFKQEGRYVKFFVKDTGRGIPEDKQEMIFERFGQADVSLTRNFEGAGLGLSIARAYTEMLGGTIGVVSQPGVGSEFYFTLPAPEGESMVSENKSEATQAAGFDFKLPKLKILVAEDDYISTQFFNIRLKNIATELHFTTSGPETIAFVRNNPNTDLVLMDIKMPGIDGLEATRQIRQFNSDIIIVAQTAYALAGDREKAMKAGCNEYLAKPIKIESLRGLIQKFFH